MEPSERSNIAPFYVMEVMRAAEEREASGGEVLHLEVGQPSTSAPAGVLETAAHALTNNKLGYTGAAGLSELREGIAGWYRDRYQLDIPTERIVVTTGASGSCVVAFLAMFEPGHTVAVLEPGYPCYRNDLKAFGANVISLAVGHESGFRPTIQQIEQLGPIDGLVVASPSNPTGTILPDDLLSDIVAWSTQNQVRLIVDEIYHGISYDVATPSALAYGEEVVVINSFSKYFSMTGWRLGWVVAPPNMASAIERLAQSLTIAPPTLSQLAAIAAFDCTDELEANVARYRTNRSIVLAGLERAGLKRMAPADGAFYAWVDVSEFGIDSQILCARWLDELGIAATPGIDFDLKRGSEFVRFSYAGAEIELREAMDRLARWTAEHR